MTGPARKTNPRAPLSQEAPLAVPFVRAKGSSETQYYVSDYWLQVVLPRLRAKAAHELCSVHTRRSRRASHTDRFGGCRASAATRARTVRDGSAVQRQQQTAPSPSLSLAA